jgi:RNA polymerase sigma-70 factor (ECF subfamily)
LEAWVFQITRNAIADHFRRRQDLQHAGSTLSATDTVQLSDNLNTTIAHCLGTLIEHLPEDQQRAVTMYELEGIAQKEIAALESISLSGVKSRIQRGRKNLESMLRDCCQFQFDRRGNILQCETTAEKHCGDSDCGCAAECS